MTDAAPYRRNQIQTPTNKLASPSPVQNQKSARVHKQKRRPATATRSGLLYGVAGFVLGAVFWHIVGFWAFVSEAVFSGPRDQIARSGQSTRSIETGSIGRANTDALSPGQSNVMSPIRPTAAHIDPNRPKAQEPLNPQTGLQPLPQTGTLNCADLALDRQTGTTWAGDCGTAIMPNGIKTTTQQQSAASAAPLSRDDLDVPEWSNAEQTVSTPAPPSGWSVNVAPTRSP